MPAMETITIINKSGKVVSTGKHLVNIFKDAKEAYSEKKAALRTEHRQRIEFKAAQKLLEARNETQSVASSHRSHRSHRNKDKNGVSRPPLTSRNLSYVEEGSVTSSRRSRSQHGSRRGSYRSPHVEDEGPAHPGLARRHTDFPPNDSQLTHRSMPPAYSQITRRASETNIRDHEHIDMNLAYGSPPPDFMLPRSATEREREVELNATMTKLDNLLLEAHCVQHSATAIIKNLQDNPEAMAAVALTLAELSNILSKMSPAILTALKSSSPAAFALLASPQFLIAGGLALGVTVVMFGGYKIVKKIQADAAKKEANRMEEALVWDANEMGSIESWRRGISAADGIGDTDSHAGTSVDGEFITPEAARQKKERMKEKKREDRERERERSSGFRGDTRSVAGSESTIRRRGSDSTLRPRDIPVRSKAAPAASESGRSERTERSRREAKGKEVAKASEKKSSSKKSTLSVIFNKTKSKDTKGKGKESESGKSHRPRIVDL